MPFTAIEKPLKASSSDLHLKTSCWEQLSNTHTDVKRWKDCVSLCKQKLLFFQLCFQFLQRSLLKKSFLYWKTRSVLSEAAANMPLITNSFCTQRALLCVCACMCVFVWRIIASDCTQTIFLDGNKQPPTHVSPPRFKLRSSCCDLRWIPVKLYLF